MQIKLGIVLIKIIEHRIENMKDLPRGFKMGVTIFINDCLRVEYERTVDLNDKG